MHHYRHAGAVPSNVVATVHEWSRALAADLKLRTLPVIRFVETAPAPGRDVLTSWRYRMVGWFEPTQLRAVVFVRYDLAEHELAHALAHELRHAFQWERGQWPRQGGEIPADHPLEADADRYGYSDICRRVLHRPVCRFCKRARSAA